MIVYFKKSVTVGLTLAGARKSQGEFGVREEPTSHVTGELSTGCSQVLVPHVCNHSDSQLPSDWGVMVSMAFSVPAK